MQEQEQGETAGAHLASESEPDELDGGDGQYGEWEAERIAPRADVLVESMRDIGYSLETALADVIDNAITSGAKNIEILAERAEAGYRIAVIDDGCGMLRSELMDALRLGSRSPLEEREKADLGRFGMGLKTASFSQCRRLTVLSRKEGRTCSAVWDLDHIAETNDWIVQVPKDHTLVPGYGDLGKTGTVILWQKLDRVVGDVDDDKVRQHFTRRLDDASRHLELVFHRFLVKEPGKPKLRMTLNNRELQPRDPFHSNHPSTTRGPREEIAIGGSRVVLQPFTLPHHSMVSQDDWQRYAGPEGYIKNQGFYVYRERRLIIYGTWFGLARQTDLTKLARVRIDMPNELDSDWKIDVKKASAQPPRQVRERLRRLIDEMGGTSKRAYTARGKRVAADGCLPVWTRSQERDSIRYRVNLEHPAVTDYMDQLSDGRRNALYRLLELVESGLPLDVLLSDLSGQPKLIQVESISDETLKHALVHVVERLTESRLKDEDIERLLKSTEPFCSNWSRTQELLVELRAGGPHYE